MTTTGKRTWVADDVLRRVARRIQGGVLDVHVLEILYLSGNQFTGCIPRSLWSVPEHDLDELGLEPCEQ